MTCSPLIIQTVHLLLISTNFRPQVGGVEMVVERQAQQFIALGHQVTLITSRSGAANYRTERVGRLTIHRCYLGIPAVSSTLLFPPLALWTCMRLYAALRNSRPDLIHLHFADNATQYALWLKRWLGIPLVISLHGNDVEKFPQAHPALGKLLRRGLNSAEFITACSTQLLHAAQIASQTNVQAVPNGVDAQQFSDTPAYQHAKPYLLTIARLVHKKGVDVLLNAFAQLTDDDHDLIIVGDGTERDTLEALTKSHQLGERVHFLGRVDPAKIPALLAGCTLFVLASRQEPFGIVLLEAMAAGKTVVATRVGGVPEFVIDRRNGRLVAADDAKQLAQVLDALLLNSAEIDTLASAGQQLVRENYRWEQQTQTFLDIYATLEINPALDTQT